MATTLARSPQPAAPERQHEVNRWLTLSVLCASLLVIVVDNTIVNVALPTLTQELKDIHQRPAMGRRRVHAGVRWAPAHDGVAR